MQKLQKRLESLIDETILMYRGERSPVFRTLRDECKIGLASTLLEWDKFYDVPGWVILEHLRPRLDKEELYLMPIGMPLKADDYRIKTPIHVEGKDIYVLDQEIEVYSVCGITKEPYFRPETYEGYTLNPYEWPGMKYLYVYATTKQRIDTYLIDYLDQKIKEESLTTLDRVLKILTT